MQCMLWVGGRAVLRVMPAARGEASVSGERCQPAARRAAKWRASSASLNDSDSDGGRRQTRLRAQRYHNKRTGGADKVYADSLRVDFAWAETSDRAKQRPLRPREQPRSTEFTRSNNGTLPQTNE